MATAGERMNALTAESHGDSVGSHSSMREKEALKEMTYKETKAYLISQGLSVNEMGTVNKFYLREIAKTRGIDLAPILKAKDGAAAASHKADSEAAEAKQAAQAGVERQRRASLAADEAKAKAQSEAESATKAAEEQAKLAAEAEKAARLAAEAEAAASRAKQAAAEAEEAAARKAAEEAAAAAEAEARRLKEEEEAKALAEKAAAEEAARQKAEAAAAEARAREEEEARREAEAEALTLKAAEEAAERERLRAAAEAEQKARELAEAQAAEKKKVFYQAWKSVVTLQKLRGRAHRGRVIKSIVRQLLTASSILQSGNIFLKFSKDGPPHDRLVWISDNLRTLKWCSPEKNRTHDLKPEAQLNLNDISAVEGIKTELFKASVKKRDDGANKMSLLNALKKDHSQVVKKGDGISSLCCFSIISQSRTVDLVAPSNRVRDDWLWALRMVLVHMNTTGSLKDVAAQRRLVGEVKTSAGLHTATSLLSDEYVTCEYDIPRTNMGMGIIMDSASNVIVELEPEGTGGKAGLQVVTVIQDGMIVPRSAVNSAIDPTKSSIKITVFRPANPLPGPIEEEGSEQLKSVDLD